MQVSTDRFDEIELRGGLDLLTPTRKLRSGMARDALNFEQSINGGYSRVAGYERYDGRPAPSAASYLILMANISGAIAVGDTMAGVTSGATGVVISVADGLVAYTKATGAFLVAETINVAASPQGTVTELGGVGEGDDWDAVQLGLAADVYRADILAVPGSGPIRGVASLDGVRYAWRNNAGGTALAIYKSTSGGWSAVSLGFELAFTLGTSEYSEGETVSRGGASATVRRVSLESGSWGAGTAAGRLILASVTGGPFTAGVSAGGGAATLSGAETAIALLPGGILPNGRVQTDKGNFGGGRRLYGCDGANRGFEFDGTYYVPINTGQTSDIPTQVLVHKGHLFFAFGTNLMHSSIASITNLYPQFNWTVAGGAAQYAMSGTINTLLRQPGDQGSGAMSISMKDTTDMLYGNSAIDFRVVPFEQSAGAKAYGAQSLGGQSLVFGDTGIFSISATQSFGNFSPSALTMNIRPFTQVRRNLATASLINREKSQYRVFFSDGYGLYMTMVNGRMLGVMPISFPNSVTCACQGDSPDGTETSFFGSPDGFVYQLDSGTSHDGAAINAYLTLTFTGQGNFQVLKNYRGMSFDIQGDGYCNFSVTYELGYGDVDIEQGAAQTAAVRLAATYWDAFTWDAFTWDGRILAPTSLGMDGTAENVALRIESGSAIFRPFTINSATLRYKARRSVRIA